MSYKFGVTTISGKTGWLMQSASINKSSQEALGLNESGEPAVAHFYQKVAEASFECIIPEGESSIPEIGDVFTYDSVRYYVTGVTLTESNTDFQKYSLTCKRYTTAGLPAAATE